MFEIKKYRIVKRGHNQWQIRLNDNTPSYSEDTKGKLICICFSEDCANHILKALENC